MFKILCNDGLEEDIVKKLSMRHEVILNHYPKDELNKMIKDIDILVIRSKTKVDKELVDHALKTKKLKLIIRAGVGLDNIDFDYCLKHGIKVHNTPKASTQVVAELTLSFMLALSRRITYANQTMKDMTWEKNTLVGSELYGKTLGIIGFGRIGQKVAYMASIFDMHIIYYDVMKHDSPYEQVSLDDLYQQSDYITLHAPSQDKPFIDFDTLKLLKKGCHIINTSRGSAINEEALMSGLDQGIIKSAALDVYQVEPNNNEKLTTYQQVILTPHIGANTNEASKRIALEVYEIIKKYEEIVSMPKRLEVGMPVLMEFQSIEENIHLAAQLKLDFIELNMNFLYCMPTHKLRQHLIEGKEKYHLFYTFHYYDNVDISSPNPNYLNYLVSDIKLIGESLNGLITKLVLHIEPGSFMTIHSEKHYVYKYDKDYVSRTVKNIQLLQDILAPYNILIVLENVPIHPYMESLYQGLKEAHISFTWDIGHDVIYEHYLFSTFRNKYDLDIKHMHMHNVLNVNDHQRLTQGKLNIKEYIKYAMNHNLSVVIEVKDKENLIESVQYLFDYVDAIGDQVVEDHIWTP
jgi:D-3-phosphoglycerate dehydrogenase / 2-oxoglutarate reductase